MRCDRFTEAGLEGEERGERFFLSHCHEDHMLGLANLGPYLDTHWPGGETDRQVNTPEIRIRIVIILKNSMIINLEC